jgi:outer membrane lipoprotein SlyB
MADEARLNELLDLVEQARAEGDTDTEQKAVAAYKRESAPTAPVAIPGIGGMGNFNPFASRIQADASRGMAELGMTPENVANPTLNALGPLETVMQGGSGLAGMLAGGWSGIGQGVKNTFAPQPDAMQAGDRVRQVQGAMTYQPRTGLGQGMSRIVGLPGEAWSAGTNWAGEKTTDVTGSPLLGTTIKTAGDLAPALLSGGETLTTRGIASGARTGRYAGKQPQAIPTTEQLKSATTAMYKAADDEGVVIRPESTQRVVDMLHALAKEENLSATRLPPKMGEAVTILKERIANKDPLTLKDADKVRQLIKDAADSTDPTDRRMGVIAKDQFDDYLDTLSPEDTLAGNSARGVALLEEARGLHRRRKNSELVDDMEERASVTAEKNYTQAGIEHAIRGEFSTLAKNMREKKKYSPEEWAAIQKVAKPGVFANTMRNVGKFDPSKGGMGATLGLGVGGGLGATVGGLLGGPAGAGAGAMAGQAALGTAAHLANRKSLSITKRNVEGAREALVGRGESSRPGLLSNDKPLVSSHGLLGEAKARPVGEIRGDLQVLDAEVKRLAEIGPVADTVRKSVEAEVVRLRRELAAAESQAASL